MAQQTILQIAQTVVRVDNLAVIVLSQRINGQIATLKIIFQRDIRCGIASKTGVTGTGFSVRYVPAAYSSCVCGCRNTGKIAAYLLVARVEHLLWRTADHHPISVFDR
ncbi:Uncharacterised protein [Escherichia coli]|uniref:Uncharacterized protein n=1 Tax=Escherichia coli TaxID=562 RepID=A0A2X3JNU5_ECOLX|nr:Uncharacterised protein [Escherichia coli]